MLGFPHRDEPEISMRMEMRAGCISLSRRVRDIISKRDKLWKSITRAAAYAL